MQPLFFFRLFLDLVGAGLLLLGLAYWWLGNLAHELIGTGMFVLIIAHNLFNRRWYGTIGRAGRDGRRLTVVILNALLLVAMLTLLATSLLISESLFTFLPRFGAMTARDFHILAAYWILVIAGLHIGSNATIIMNTTRRLLRLNGESAAQTWVLRTIALALVLQGIRSSLAIGLGTRLQGEVSLDLFWDFESDANGFFLHVLSVLSMYAVIGHYVLNVLLRKSRRQPERAGQG